MTAIAAMPARPGQPMPSQVTTTSAATASTPGWVRANHSTRQISRTSWTTMITGSGVRYTGRPPDRDGERVAVVDLGELLARHPVTAARH